MTSVRVAVAEDARQIAKIWNCMITDTLVTFTTDLKSEEAIIADITTRTPAYLVAEHSGVVVGFATYAQFRGGTGYAATVENTVMLTPLARGMGIGRILMTELQQIACDAGHHVMVAGISGANPAAIRFHAALGFVRVAHLPEVGRKWGRWLDLILMQKTL